MWFLCLRRPLIPPDPEAVTLDEHLAWMRQQHERGVVYLSGPGQDGDGNRFGLYLIRAASQVEAESVAAGDPFTAKGGCTFELIEWEVHQILGAGAFSLAALRANAPPDRG